MTVQEWPLVPLGELCRWVASGGTPLRSVLDYYVGGTIPWLKTGEVKKSFVYETEEFITERGLENSSTKLIPSNSLIVAMYGDGDTAGNVAINKIPLTTNQACCNFVVDDAKADYRYLYYYLKGSYANLVGLKVGGSQQNLNSQTLRRFPIALPLIATQRKIAAILCAYDDLIANNQRRIALLESMAEEIYREWFVRMRFPGHQKVLRFKGLPSSWTLKPFKNFCVLKRGYDLPDSSMQPGHYPVIASTSIKGFHNEFKVNPPVITTGRSGSLGTVLLVNKKSWPLNTALYVKDFCGNSPFLIYYTLRSLKLETFNVGAGVPTLNRNHLASLGIAVPDAALQRRFDAVLEPMNAQASVLAVANEKLAASRDALLPRLISGKLKVDHLAVQLPPSMREKVTA
jgi:type I restriction enzyme, S subunit